MGFPDFPMCSRSAQNCSSCGGSRSRFADAFVRNRIAPRRLFTLTESVFQGLAMRALGVSTIALCFCLLAGTAAHARRILAAAARTYAADQPSPYLFAWASSADTSQPDFLAVIDALPSSPTFGDIVATVSTGIPVNLAHHTDYEMPPGGVLFANDYPSGLTFRFDLHNPRHPKLLGVFGGAGPYTHPHSFVHLPDGHVLATYQMKGAWNDAPGALVELDGNGRLLRSGDAADPSVDKFIRPYSLAVVPSLDRVVTSSYDMYETGASYVVQVWRLSDLRLLKTIRLPGGPYGLAGVNSAEPRVLADGRTVLVSTFNCGLYRIIGLDGDNPSASLIYDFRGSNCAVPVVAGHYWIQPVWTVHVHMAVHYFAGKPHFVPLDGKNCCRDAGAVVAVDISNPSKPVEADRLTLGPKDFPHWLSLEPDGRRLVLTGYLGLQNQIVIINLGKNGQLSIDPRFHNRPAGSEPGIRLDSRHWPHGGSGPAIPHGVVFSLP